ncbi:hypothetical protein SAICODRAFT_7623 [Saitoella complicata NRRL Y-17804]|nr:uncharacterized protein SAICODRAFT_7623 [Saitoella complicata NRRL Y-17804]ODQ53025.1 hypothetical protein SAICODRAFT_7623 [Saitoella complicata NRRL Y-17804]
MSESVAVEEVQESAAVSLKELITSLSVKSRIERKRSLAALYAQTKDPATISTLIGTKDNLDKVGTFLESCLRSLLPNDLPSVQDVLQNFATYKLGQSVLSSLADSSPSQVDPELSTSLSSLTTLLANDNNSFPILSNLGLLTSITKALSNTPYGDWTDPSTHVLFDSIVRYVLGLSSSQQGLQILTSELGRKELKQAWMHIFFGQGRPCPEDVRSARGILTLRLTTLNAENIQTDVKAEDFAVSSGLLLDTWRKCETLQGLSEDGVAIGDEHVGLANQVLLDLAGFSVYECGREAVTNVFLNGAFLGLLRRLQEVQDDVHRELLDNIIGVIQETAIVFANLFTPSLVTQAIMLSPPVFQIASPALDTLPDRLKVCFEAIDQPRRLRIDKTFVAYLTLALSHLLQDDAAEVSHAHAALNPPVSLIGFLCRLLDEIGKAFRVAVIREPEHIQAEGVVKIMRVPRPANVDVVFTRQDVGSEREWHGTVQWRRQLISVLGLGQRLMNNVVEGCYSTKNYKPDPLPAGEGLSEGTKCSITHLTAMSSMIPFEILQRCEQQMICDGAVIAGKHAVLRTLELLTSIRVPRSKDTAKPVQAVGAYITESGSGGAVVSVILEQAERSIVGVETAFELLKHVLPYEDTTSTGAITILRNWWAKELIPIRAEIGLFVAKWASAPAMASIVFSLIHCGSSEIIEAVMASLLDAVDGVDGNAVAAMGLLRVISYNTEIFDKLQSALRRSRKSGLAPWLDELTQRNPALRGEIQALKKSLALGPGVKDDMEVVYEPPAPTRVPWNLANYIPGPTGERPQSSGQVQILPGQMLPPAIHRRASSTSTGAVNPNTVSPNRSTSHSPFSGTMPPPSMSMTPVTPLPGDMVPFLNVPMGGGMMPPPMMGMNMGMGTGMGGGMGSQQVQQMQAQQTQQVRIMRANTSRPPSKHVDEYEGYGPG